MSARADPLSLHVVVPFYNEKAGLPATLQALTAQVDLDFTLVLVDNASTDGSAAIAERFALANVAFPTHVVREPVKGTGAAADTGFRFAIARGASWIARTDADCLPDPRWVRTIRNALCDDGLEFVAGRILPRTDEAPLGARQRLAMPILLWLAENYGKVHRRGPQFRYPYFMAAGNNLAITAGLYARSGGFPRTALEELNEDRVLSETVRTLTTRAGLRHDMIVRNSTRRMRAYGFVNTLRWYCNRGYHPAVVDIR